MRIRASSVQKGRVISRRLFILTAAKLFLFAGITYRLYSLQISDREKYEILSDKNRIREWKTPPQRGLITDFYNKILADNDRVFQVHLSLDEIKNFDQTIFRLRNIINLSNNEIRKIYKTKKKLKPWDTLIVSNNLEWSEFSRLNLYLHELEGVKPVVSSSRYYPYGNNVVHVVGYVGEASLKDIERMEEIKENLVAGLKVGKSGIEYSNEKLLIGKYGIKRYEVNSSGKRISQLEYIKESQGSEIKTTIDLDVQKFSQELLKDQAGSICAMDIYTGEIIAMASSPTYDPNKFTHGINHKDWNEIRDNPLKPLVNKSIAGLYSPGSTFKPLVALTALEYGILSPNFKVKCKGVIEMYGQKYHCWKDKGHGYMSLRNAIKQSCDIFFYEMARKLGVDKLAVIAKKYGLGSKVLGDVYFDEKKGLVPDTKWKKNNLGRSWLLGETIINGIGQGYIQTSPLQLCLMTAQLANGGYKIKPHIINDESISFEEIKSLIKKDINSFELSLNKNTLPLNENLSQQNTKSPKRLYKNKKNIKFVLDAMFGSTNEPGGTSFQIEYKNRDHALYIAFAPYKEPRYSISVLIEHGGSGSKTAAPLANKLIKKIIDRHEIREQTRKANLTLV
jgi:penicillin-binding protein 2